MSDNEKRHSEDHSGPPPVSPDDQTPDALLESQNGKGRLILKAREVVYRTPEVRPEKVAELKEAIEAGTYEIDTEKVADKIIDELFPKR
jgi:flagellar biosynthesis anti-sigma factor FlgM